MRVSVILGFDRDGQVVVKWRESFQRHGVLEGELSIREEEDKSLRRHTMVARLLDGATDLTPPLYDAVVRFALNDDMSISGIARDEPFDKWRSQAWRMKILP